MFHFFSYFGFAWTCLYSRLCNLAVLMAMPTPSTFSIHSAPSKHSLLLLPMWLSVWNKSSPDIIFLKNIQNFDSIRKQFSSKSKNGKQVPNVCFNNRLGVHLCKQMCIVYFVSWWNLIPIYFLCDCCRTVYKLLSLNLLFII